MNASNTAMLMVFDGHYSAKQVDLESFGKDIITFGRHPDNDLVLKSDLVSGFHGRLVKRYGEWIMEDKEVYEDKGSTNGLIYHDFSVPSIHLTDGDFIRIDDWLEPKETGVLFVFSASKSQGGWRRLPVSMPRITIGRDKTNTICLEHPGASGLHAVIERHQDGYYITDMNSSNGTIINDSRLIGTVLLHEKDVISITNTKIIFTPESIYYCSYTSGVSIDASDIVIERKQKRKKNITCNHVNLKINPGELVAIIGGSGAGKSTIMNAISGYLKPKTGEVYINGSELYRNFDSLKQMIGYVPQSDIVYDNLSLADMLKYTAELRLPRDTSEQEINRAVDKALQTVELTEKRDSMIKNLSGGQKKRASIAVELLADPSLLFLDEPASGLDPGTERNLMTSLREMADAGKTVVLVTHSTLQLQMCDKIVFMGKGGNLCFFGSYDEALKFFGITDIVDVYRLLTDESDYWKSVYDQQRLVPVKKKEEKQVQKGGKLKGKKQLPILTKRYFQLVWNQRRFIGYLIEAPLLAFIISFVKNGNQFEEYDITKSLLFAVACCAFWMGMLNAIQEICKERNILKREYMTGLSLTAYVLSKIVVIGFLCLLQSILVIVVFAARVGLPDEGVIMGAFLEFFLTTVLSSIASAALGLAISSIFKNPDKAMAAVPVALLPQMLFSGLLFKLEGITKGLSYITICRWSMEGYGTTSDLNALPLRLQRLGFQIPHEAEDFFTHTAEHLLKTWGILLIMTVFLLIITRIVIGSIGKSQE